MSTKTRTCPKCNAEMEEGFLLDSTYGSINHKTTTWIQGTPEKGLLTNIKTHGRTLMNVVTFRCPACGYLESYAT
jgi:hypothetical protein